MKPTDFFFEQAGRKTQELGRNILILKILKFTDLHQNMKLSKLVNFTAPSLTGSWLKEWFMQIFGSSHG